MYSVTVTGAITVIENGILQLAKTFIENNNSSISEFVYNTYTTPATNPTTTTINMGNIGTAAYVYMESTSAFTLNVTTGAGVANIPVVKNILLGVAATGITITTTGVTTVKVVICGA